MQHKTLIHLLIAAILVLCMLPVAVSAQDAGVDAETALEQAKALAAEQSPAVLPATVAVPSGAVDPLFIGVDDATVPAYTVNPTTNALTPHTLGVQVWGSAYDAANDIVYINNGSTLYSWLVGNPTVTTLGTITDPAGATQAMVGLAFYNGVLYGVKNIANEAVYTIDTTTRVATVYIDYIDADYDFGGLAADPNTGTLYATNDDTTPHGSGLFRINLNGTATQIAPYPAGQTDIDGLAVSNDGFAYLVTDEPGFIYVWDFTAGAYATPLNNPWTSSEVFSAGAWIWQPVQDPSISLAKTVGTDRLTCAVTDQITVAPNTEVTYCYEVTNTGGVTLSLHDLNDSELGSLLSGFPYALPPGASAFLTETATIAVTTVNTATWMAYNVGPSDVVTATDTATVTVEIPGRCPVGSSEVTLLSESFEGGFPPVGWVLANTTTGCVAPGLPDWTNTDPGANGNLTGGTGLFATADSDACGSGNVMNAQMWTPALDLTGYTDPQISYYTDYNDISSASDVADLDFSTDGGSTWTNLISWNEDHRGPLQVVQPFAAGGQANTVLRWNYSNATWDWWWQVDEVVVTACEPSGGGDPNIYVDPLSMASTQATNVQVQQTLTISNTGGGMLNWDIDEEDTTLPAIDAPAALTPQPAAEVAGAPEGAAPEAAQGQSALWRGPAAVLYDNGPQVTHPGGGAGGADASAVQTGLGNSTYGFGHAVSSGFRVADDFTVPAGGWNVASITFFAYQTGSTTASTINAVNVRIWDGPPNAGGTVIWGDTTTNRLASSAWSNIYRVLDSALTNSQRPIMADVATVGTFLPAGTYWVDWQTGGTLASGPWAHPVTILGQVAKPGANGLQYDPTAAAWNPLVDTGAAAQQDLPFIIEGTAGGGNPDPCTALADIPWLTLSPASGANAGGTATDVTVTFDSTSMAPGTYTGNLCITSDDPDAGPGNETELVIVPVTLTVTDPTAVTLDGLSATPLPAAGLPLAALPAAIGLALGAAYALRRRQ
jgi:hypothetical protein